MPTRVEVVLAADALLCIIVAAAEPSAQALFDEGAHALFQSDDKARDYQRAIDAYAKALVMPLSNVDRGQAHARRAEAYLRLGDVSAERADRLAAYRSASGEADLGIAADERCADCWFWRSASLGRWGQTKGVLDALFLLDDVRGGFARVLALAPGHLGAALALGKIDEALPGFAGGSSERAEAAFRRVSTADPHFTRATLDLAELLFAHNRSDEARRLCASVIAEAAPTFPHEHRKFDLARAKLLLDEGR